MEKIDAEKINIRNLEDFTSVSGRGVKGKIDGKLYFGGNIAFMNENNIVISEKLKGQSEKLLEIGKTVLYFANETEVIRNNWSF